MTSKFTIFQQHFKPYMLPPCIDLSHSLCFQHLLEPPSFIKVGQGVKPSKN